MPRKVASIPPIAVVAARAGVSIATVSRVVNRVPNRAAAATVLRVQEAVAALGYRPLSAGRALRERRSRLVAVLAPNLANPAMSAIAASVEVAMRLRGLVMVACDTHDDPAIQDEYLLEMRAQQVRVTVLLGAVASPGLDAAAELGDALVFVGRRPPVEGTHAYIAIDNWRAGADAAGFFLARGLPVLGVLHGAMSSSATAERIAGFRACLARHGLPLGDGQVRTLYGADHTAIGMHCAPPLLNGRVPAGVFCSSDLIAYGAYRALTEMRVRVPEDVSLFGFDDNPLNDWIAPWLSSIQVPYAGFGPAVVAALDRLEAGDDPSETVLPHYLIERNGSRTLQK